MNRQTTIELIKQITEEQRDLELQLTQSLNSVVEAFQDRTGIPVTDIHFERFWVGSSEFPVTWSVRTELKLGK